MTIVLCGGGSGGHITPLLAVARELRKQHSSIKLIYVGEKGGKFSHIAEDSGLFDEYRYVSAGKLRRYHGESLLRRITDIKTIALNIRDISRLIVGTIQSIYLFKKLHADSVLLKGGYVCVPASIGAKFAGALIITHDSDAVPGLSNRFAARYASFHATGMPARYYSYPDRTVRPVGLPIDDRFKSYSANEVKDSKRKYKIPEEARVVLVTGGSNGAQRLNGWVIDILQQLFNKNSELYVVVVCGKGNLSQFKALSGDLTKRLIVLEFSSELYLLSAMADVIVTRAGATTIAEFAAQAKACIIVPNPDLTGGHQLKNAEVYEKERSGLVVRESQLVVSAEPLYQAVDLLLGDDAKRKKLGENLQSTVPKIPAAQALANLLIGKAK